jgi:hypothetical protein
MHKLCLHRIKAPSPEFACEKANELLNPIKPPKPNITGKTIENIKKTNVFKDEYDSNLDECLEGICNTESSICYDFINELIEMDCKNSAEEIENLYGILISNFTPFYHIIGCLSENNKSYINGDPKYHRWDVNDYSIEGLNKSYQKEFANFNVLKDLNEIEPDESDDSISLWELNYEEEKGETYLVFSDTKID